MTDLAGYLFSPKALGVVRTGYGVHGEAVLAADQKIAAALDGPMFAGGSNVRFFLRDRSRGLEESSDEPRNGMTISVVRSSGAVSVQRGAGAPANADVAVQLYPSLVWEGQNEAHRGTDAENRWRAAVSVQRDGRLGFWVGIGPMYTFAERLIAAGARYAGYTDGGTSAGLVTRQGRTGDRGRRPVPSWIVAEELGAFGSLSRGQTIALVGGTLIFVLAIAAAVWRSR